MARFRYKSLNGKNFKQIVFAGIGGSAIAADLVRSYAYFESSVPIIVVRDYELPAYVDSSTLVFISSYSGNTIETLNAYSLAKEKKAEIICISSGGSLKETANKDSTVFIELPQGLPARCALGFLSIIPLSVLAELGLIKDITGPVDETIKVLNDLMQHHLNPALELKDNIARFIAGKLFGKFAVIYSGFIHFDTVGMRLRGELAENAKILSSCHTFPEAGHNEIMGWQRDRGILKDFTVLMLRDKFMDQRVARAMELAKRIIQEQGFGVFDIWSQGKSLLSRMFSLIYIGDFISYYLAIMSDIDPTPIDKVEYLKNELSAISKNFLAES